MPGQADGGSEGETFTGLRDEEVLSAIFLDDERECPLCEAGTVNIRNRNERKAHLENVHHLTIMGTLEAKKELIAFERTQQTYKMSLGFFLASSLAAWFIINVVAHGKVSITLGG